MGVPGWYLQWKCRYQGFAPSGNSKIPEVGVIYMYLLRIDILSCINLYHLLAKLITILLDHGVFARNFFLAKYSGTLLILSPMGHNKLAILTWWSY